MAPWHPDGVHAVLDGHRKTVHRPRWRAGLPPQRRRPRRGVGAIGVHMGHCVDDRIPVPDPLQSALEDIHRRQRAAAISLAYRLGAAVEDLVDHATLVSSSTPVTIRRVVAVNMRSPASICSSVVNSRSLWETPSTLGTNSITVGTTSRRLTESCPAIVGISRQLSPRSSATAPASAIPESW